MRADGVREGRHLLVEAELHASGRDRVQVNGQPLRRARDLLGRLLRHGVRPGRPALVKGGPQGRREYLDDLLVALHPRHDATITEVERVLKQRNALLKSAGVSAGRRPAVCRGCGQHPRRVGRQAGEAGEALAAAREALIDQPWSRS